MMTISDRKDVQTRARAALWGIAVGDAFGKMTEGFWPPQIALRYGGPLEEFRPPVRANSDAPSAYSYAEITDDTRFVVLIAQSIIARGGVDERDIVRRILAEPIKGWPGWEDFARGASDGQRMSRTGNGAPSRVAPVGIIHSTGQIEQIVEDVYACCRCTHDFRSAVAAACAVAAGYSAVVEGKEKEAVLETCIEAAVLGDKLGVEDYLPSVPRRLEWLQKVYLNTRPDPKQRPNPGFSAWEGAVTALYLFMKHRSARDAIAEAANWGGDADSIASMAGGMLAAMNPEGLPEDWRITVKERNGLELDALGDRLLRVRHDRAENTRTSDPQ